MRESSAGSPLCYLRLQRSLRSRLIVCVMSLMAQGAHRGRPVAAAPCTPGLRPAKSPLRGPFDLSLQASGRAEAASLQNTALSPHPCGLPRPSGNVSAILRPPTLAVSASMVNKLKAGRTDRRPDKAQPPSGRNRRNVARRMAPVFGVILFIRRDIHRLRHRIMRRPPPSGRYSLSRMPA